MPGGQTSFCHLWTPPGHSTETSGVPMSGPPMSAASIQGGYQPGQNFCYMIHEGFSRKTHRGPMNSMPNMGSMPAMPGLGRNHSYFNRYDKIKVEYLLNLVYHTLKSGTHALRNDFKKRQSVSFPEVQRKIPTLVLFPKLGVLVNPCKTYERVISKSNMQQAYADSKKISWKVVVEAWHMVGQGLLKAWWKGQIGRNYSFCACLDTEVRHWPCRVSSCRMCLVPK